MTEIEGVDLAAVGEWMETEGLPGGPITDVERLGGGSQNVMVAFVRGGTRYVLRRGPLHLRPKTNESIRREARVFAGLATSDVPHARLHALCDDESVLGGAVFYLCDRIDGFNPALGLPDLHAGDAGVRREMAFGAVDALARVGAVDHVAAGLADLGQPEGFLDRQVGRWLSELDSYGQHEGYEPADLGGVHEVAAWLDVNRPRHWTPGLLHGDFHPANLLFSPNGPGVAAVVDWEMCTVGDPLLDLGLFLMTLPDPDGRPAALSGAWGSAGGLPRPKELVVRYAERSTRLLDAIEWYVVCACFKEGIILEGTHARAQAGKASKGMGRLLHRVAVELFDRARLVMVRGLW